MYFPTPARRRVATGSYRSQCYLVAGRCEIFTVSHGGSGIATGSLSAYDDTDTGGSPSDSESLSPPPADRWRVQVTASASGNG